MSYSAPRCWKALALALALFLGMPAPSSTSAPVQVEKREVLDGGRTIQLSGEARKEAMQLVRQLGSPNFELRQQATRQLWQMGRPALEVIKLAADGSFNNEAKMRSRDLLTFIRIGLPPDADNEVVDCIAGFFDRELSVKKRAVQKLCHLNEQIIVRKLIALDPSKSDQSALKECCSIASSDAELALRMGDEKKFREWLNDPTTRESQKLLFYYTLWVDGRLEPEIDRLKELAKVEIEAGRKYDEKQKEKSLEKVGSANSDPPKQSSLRTLIGLLRFLERWEEALSYSDKLQSRDRRRTIHHTIYKESGNWKALSDVLVDPTTDDLEDEERKKLFDGLAYQASGYEKALVHFYASNDERFEESLKEIEDKIQEERLKKKRRTGKWPEVGNYNHSRFLRYTLDFDRSLKYTTLKKDPTTFGMFENYRRYDRLFEEFGLTTWEKRERYFKGRARHIRSLLNQVENHTDNKDHEKVDVYSDKRDTQIRHWRDVCSLFADLGLDEEAEFYLRKLYFEFREKVNHIAAYVVQDLKNMGAYDSAWEIAKLEFERNSNFPFGPLLDPQGYEHEVVGFLNQQFKDRINDPYERCRKIAALVRSPALNAPNEIDFWQEMGDIDFSAQSNTVWFLFLIWNVEEEKLVRKSANQEESELLQQLIKDGQFLEAAQQFEAKALAENNNGYFAQAWSAYRKGGDVNKARQMRLLFMMNFDPDDAYDYTSGYNGTEWQALPFDAFRLYDCLEFNSLGTNCYYLWRIAAGDSKSVLSAHQKMVRAQILRLQYIESPYYEDSAEDHPRFIEGALAAGDVKAARRWFKKLLAFQPADSGFVEENFPSFEKVGDSELLDEMFDLVSGDFFEILKSFPDSGVYLNNYAWACARSKRNIANAIEIAKRAVALRPGKPGYLDTLAELYYVDGQHDLAIDTIRRAIRINPMRDYYREQFKKFREAKEK